MKYSRLSAHKVKKIIKCFCSDITASKTAILLDINRNTINVYYN
ncbi:MAG: IS1595 family transposase, partial [Pirellulaceae bacterium]